MAGVLRNRDHPGFRPGTSCYQVFALNDDRGVVYICWDADHAPIYVGQTVGWPSRKRVQMMTTWWEDVTMIHIIPAPDRVARHCLERALIMALEPRENIVWMAGRQNAHFNARADIRAMSQEEHSQWYDERRAEALKRRERNSAEAKAGRGPIEVGSPISSVPPWAAGEAYTGLARRRWSRDAAKQA